MVNLIDGDYELIPADFITLESASANYTDLNQDLGQVPEDPKVPIIFQYMQYMLYYYLFVHLSFRCWLKPYMHNPRVLHDVHPKTSSTRCSAN